MPNKIEGVRKLYELAHVIVSLPGGVGTLQAISFIWDFHRFLEERKPIILMGAQWQNFYEFLSNNEYINSTDLKSTEVVKDIKSLERRLQELTN